MMHSRPGFEIPLALAGRCLAAIPLAATAFALWANEQAGFALASGKQRM